MAFEFKIRTERMASCGHQADASIDLNDSGTDAADGTLTLYCVRCHSRSEFGINLVCRTCHQHYAG
jgi:hypothetical protein